MPSIVTVTARSSAEQTVEIPSLLLLNCVLLTPRLGQAIAACLIGSLVSTALLPAGGIILAVVGRNLVRDFGPLILRNATLDRQGRKQTQDGNEPHRLDPYFRRQRRLAFWPFGGENAQL